MNPTWEQIGRTLRELRESRKMTQEEVAEKVGLSRPAVSLVENGKRELNGLELAAFAELYGVTEKQVLGLNSLDATVSLQLRGEALLEDSDVQELVTWLRRAVTRYANLESLMGEEEEALLPDYQHLWRMSPVAQGLRAARSERKRLGLGDEPLASMRSLFERQHIKVFMRIAPEEASLDGMAYSGSGQQAVFLLVPLSRPLLASYRWRFTAAHEYCHLLFDRNHLNWVLAESMEQSAQSSRTEEVRANAFAAAFLLPEAGVKPEVERITGSGTLITPEVAIQLQRHFKVSHQTMVWRLFNLGLVSELERERLLRVQPQRMARQLGYDVYEEADELAESLAQLSIPPRYFYLAVRALREGKISLGSFAEHLEVDLVEARRIAAELQLNGR